MMRLVLCGLVGAVLAGISGCAHAPVQKITDPNELFTYACGIGSSVKSASGSVWFKAKSKEASGQFPADVLAESPGQLKMEVTNLVGATEAVITIKDQKYTIQGTGKNKVRNQKGFGSWGGIPLRWAPLLFLGRIPCPTAEEAKVATMSVSPEGDLTVQTKPAKSGDFEKFVYKFRSWAGKPWPESLHWEKKGPPSVQVDFTFDDPEDGTQSPTKWEARSPRGEVKLRWKERKTTS